MKDIDEFTLSPADKFSTTREDLHDIRKAAIYYYLLRLVVLGSSLVAASLLESNVQASEYIEYLKQLYLLFAGVSTVMLITLILNSLRYERAVLEAYELGEHDLDKLLEQAFYPKE